MKTFNLPARFPVSALAAAMILAGCSLTKPPEKIDGISMLPALLGRTQTNQHAALYWEFHERGFQQAARMDQWKALRPQAGEPLELYDLKSDLAEKRNVAQEHPDVVAKMESYLKSARTESPQWPIRKPEEKTGAEGDAKQGNTKSS